MAYLCDIPCQALFFVVRPNIWFVRYKANFTDSKKKHVYNLQLNMNDKTSECIMYNYKKTMTLDM